MFTGGDSTGDGVNGVNPFSNFQQAAQSAAVCGLAAPTMSCGSIDWASLAQQWIQMRDYSGADIESNAPDAPPPPKISGNFNNDVDVEKKNTNASDMLVLKNTKKSKFEEKGEADMEMDDEDDNPRSGNHQMTTFCNRLPPVAPVMQSNWFMQQNISSAGQDMSVDAHEQQTNALWNPWPPRHMSTPALNVNTNSTSPIVNNSTAHIPSLMKINVPDPSIIKSMQENSNENNSIDAAKRKILPAWIREGLEKMEREKQRQMEKHNKKPMTLSEDDSNSQTAVDTSGAQMVNKNNTLTVESDCSGNEDDDNERTVDHTAASSIGKIKTAPQSHTDAEDEDIQIERTDEALKTGKSYEQKLSDLMIVVRKTLTELLLEVTNEEICSISNEAIKSLKNKATSAQLIPKSAISTITGKLGLAAYEDSSDESSGSDFEESNKIDNYTDSEEEIKANLRIRRKTFAKTSEEIEERIAESALREEQKLKYYIEQEQHAEEQQKQKNQPERESSSGSNLNYKLSGRGSSSSTVFTSGKGYEKEFGETPDSKLQFSNGKRQKERTTRFSDIKDLKNTTKNAADYISQLKSSQVETAAQKISTALLQTPIDGLTSNASSTASATKRKDPSCNAMLGVKKESKSEVGSKHKPSSTKRESNRMSRRLSDDRDEDDSTSDSSDSSDSSSKSSNTSKTSSKNSKVSSFSTKRSSHHYSRSSSSAKKSYHSHKKSHDRDRDRHYDNLKSSRHRYHSSDSDDYGKDDHSSKKYRRSSHHRHEHYRDERKRHRSTRSRSKSRSRSRSKYSSSRRRH